MCGVPLGIEKSVYDREYSSCDNRPTAYRSFSYQKTGFWYQKSVFWYEKLRYCVGLVLQLEYSQWKCIISVPKGTPHIY